MYLWEELDSTQTHKMQNAKAQETKCKKVQYILYINDNKSEEENVHDTYVGGKRMQK